MRQISVSWLAIICSLGCASSPIRMDSPLRAEEDGKWKFPVTVNYGQTLAEMAEAGHYENNPKEIAATDELFTVKGEGKVEADLRLVHFNRQATTEEVYSYFETNNLKAASIEQLLAFGAKYSDLPREFSIIALGSVYLTGECQCRNVPGLTRTESGRKLIMESPSTKLGGWSYYYHHFLVTANK